MKKIMPEIQSFHAALLANKGIMPESWKPYANFLMASLRILRVFVSTEDKVIIDVIIAAIIASEQ